MSALENFMPEPASPLAAVQPDWTNANCRGMAAELFYPGRGESTREAKSVCKNCVVKAECLEFALVNMEKWGVWGQTSEKQRRALRRKRHIE